MNPQGIPCINAKKHVRKEEINFQQSFLGYYLFIAEDFSFINFWIRSFKNILLQLNLLLFHFDSC